MRENVKRDGLEGRGISERERGRGDKKKRNVRNGEGKRKKSE